MQHYLKDYFKELAAKREQHGIGNALSQHSDYIEELVEAKNGYRAIAARLRKAKGLHVTWQVVKQYLEDYLVQR